MDPRRFTPTLHASLVSEILGLRRDQEEKQRLIESLESDLHEARGTQENLEETLATNGKETRSLKRQLSLLEGGTSSALSELAKERDEAVENAAEIKRRLDACQKKQRSQEEDLDRTNEIYSRDKGTWEAERRKHERQIHVAESRLKTVLEEVAAFQAARDAEAEAQEVEASFDQGNDSCDEMASIHSVSIANSRTNSIRFPSMSGNGFKVVSLADELNMESDDDQETDDRGHESSMSNHPRRQSRDSILSISQSDKRRPSNDSVRRTRSTGRGKYCRPFADSDSGITEELAQETVSRPKLEYVDTGIQFSPPPSPKLEPIAVSEVPLSKVERQSSYQLAQNKFARPEAEVEANQRRKGEHAPPALEPKPPVVSSECQTLDDPLSPPRTPETPVYATSALPGVHADGKVVKVSTSTQTESPESTSSSAKPALPMIPSISIQPPDSVTESPTDSRLPAQFKDAFCQVCLPPPSYRSRTMQTEEIRVDQRLKMLPVHLHPSAIRSSPPIPERRGPVLDPINFTPVPRKNPRRAASNRSMQSLEFSSSPPIPPFSLQETYDAYPGNNDDGPLHKKASNIRRPHRISSLFAGFDEQSSDEGDFAEGELSDCDFMTPLSPSRPSFNKSVLRAAETKAALEDEVLLDGSANRNVSRLSRVSVGEHRPSHASSQMIVGTAKQGTVRKAALVSNGVGVHATRPRSPSLGSNGYDSVPPPFAIPTRASSRQPTPDFSGRSDGTVSPTREESWPSYPQPQRTPRREHRRSSAVRKVKPSAAVPKDRSQYGPRSSRSPPPEPALASERSASPGLPPMPNNDVTSPTWSRTSKKSPSHRRQQPSATTVGTGATSQVSNSTSNHQATSVVDAIAQTMVGEWMFKYVRRRKSFGVSENNPDQETPGNGVRHKRWVWLAPYERAVVWSSKQPTSGQALLGKSGRKLMIQSVLDVKDDNPGPKNETVFNRSILILTPARALKFTAINSERHYIWLSALSFLAHSSQAVPNNVQPLPPPSLPTSVPPFELPPKSAARPRKNPIRDSVRLAKGKTAPNQQGPQIVNNTTQQLNHNRNPSAVSGITVPRYGGRGERENREHDKDRGYQSSFPASPSRARNFRIPPPLFFRGFSGPGSSTSTSTHFSKHTPQASAAGLSMMAATDSSSDIYSAGGGKTSTYAASTVGTAPTCQSSIRTSNVSDSRQGHQGHQHHHQYHHRQQQSNFFDAVGTVRMEAFISRMALMPTGNISRFDNYMNDGEDSSPESGRGAEVGGKGKSLPSPGFVGTYGGWGKAPGSVTSWERDDEARKARDRSLRRRRNSRRERGGGGGGGGGGNNYQSRNGRAVVGGGGGGRRDPADFYGGSKTAGEEDYLDSSSQRIMDVWKGC